MNHSAKAAAILFVATLIACTAHAAQALPKPSPAVQRAIRSMFDVHSISDSDGECPPPQSYEFWHALVTLGVPTQFVIYPHEGHAFANPAHSRDVVERAVAWLDAHL